MIGFLVVGGGVSPQDCVRVGVATVEGERRDGMNLLRTNYYSNYRTHT